MSARVHDASPDVLSVVIVDDNELIREAFAASLEAIDCQVAKFATSEELLAYARSNPPMDAAIIDFYLGEGMDGFTCGRLMRDLWPATAVIYVSAYTMQKRPALIGPSQVLLRKPVTIEDIIDKLGELTGKTI